jgi:hypothetical protein
MSPCSSSVSARFSARSASPGLTREAGGGGAGVAEPEARAAAPRRAGPWPAAAGGRGRDHRLDRRGADLGRRQGDRLGRGGRGLGRHPRLGPGRRGRLGPGRQGRQGRRRQDRLRGGDGPRRRGCRARRREPRRRPRAPARPRRPPRAGGTRAAGAQHGLSPSASFAARGGARKLGMVAMSRSTGPSSSRMGSGRALTGSPSRRHGPAARTRTPRELLALGGARLDAPGLEEGLEGAVGLLGGGAGGAVDPVLRRLEALPARHGGGEVHLCHFG